MPALESEAVNQDTAIAIPQDEVSTPPSRGATDLEALHRVPLFACLSETELEQVRAMMETREFSPGQTIIREGESGDEFFITVEGRTRCIVLDAGGNEIVLDEQGVGGFFGELSMLTGDVRSARITALDEVTVLVLDRDEFFDFLRAHPQASINVLIVMGKRLHRTDSLLRRTVSRNVNEVVEEKLTFAARVAEALAGFSSRLSFLAFNFGVAAAWIAWNNPHLGGYDFDPYPYNLLSLSIGLEALVFSVLVLNRQGREEAKDRIAEEINHEVNKKAELEIGLILRRLDDLERSTHHANDEHLRLIRAALGNGPDNGVLPRNKTH
jgi:CRP-like cAMP-binding protein